MEAGCVPEAEETNKLRRAEIEQKIRDARKIDQQKKNDAKERYQNLQDILNKERNLKQHMKAIRLD